MLLSVPLVLLILIALTAISGLICTVEAVAEKDWPRDTFKFFAAFAALLICWLSL